MQWLLTSQQEIFDNNHRVVSQRGGQSGRFTFTAADAGDHQICFQPSSSSGRSSWLSVGQPNGGIRLTLDLAIGESSQLESTDKTKIEDITGRIKDLNARLNDVRREQVFQRVSAFNMRQTAAYACCGGLLGFSPLVVSLNTTAPKLKMKLPVC